MTVLAHRPVVAGKYTRRLLLALESSIALTAVGGGLYGLSGAEDLPREWLEGTPFESFVIPSLILLAVAGAMAAAAAALPVRHRRAGEVAIAAGALLLGWIIGEVLVIPFSWLQPLYFAFALVVIALGWRIRQAACPRARRS